MKKIIGMNLLVISRIFEFLVGALLIIGVIYEILGPVSFEELTIWLNIPWSLGLYYKAGIICLAFLMITS